MREWFDDDCDGDIDDLDRTPLRFRGTQTMMVMVGDPLSFVEEACEAPVGASFAV